VALGRLVTIEKGLSYKGAFLDKPGPSLLGLGVVQPGGGFRKGKERSYGGPFKPQQRVRPGDLFIALTDLTQEGLVLGSPVLVPEGFGPALITHHVAAVRPRPDARVNPRYLYYALCADGQRGHFRAVATGTTVRAVSPADASLVAIPLPPVPVQERIAALLSALDDKIDLNERNSRTLEEIAQTLFRAWFFDFLGQDPLTFEDSELGPTPRGWQVSGLDSLLEIDPRLPLAKGTAAISVDMKALPIAGPSVSGWVTRPYGGGARFQQGDTLLARITPCLENGKSALVDFLREGQVAFGSTEFIVLRPKVGVPRTWPYCLVRHEPFRAHAIANMTGSSGRQRVPADALVNFRVAVPPADQLRRFGEATESLFQRISVNTRETSDLRALRDALLPKLISGELRVA
jgi:type I restriction enzyme S subunit